MLWQAIQEWLPIQVKTRKRKHSLRLIINAILYVAKAGIQWRMMPNDLPAWSLVYWYASPALVQAAVDAASSQGWRRPLLAWLGVQLKLFEASGNRLEAERIQRRIALTLKP